jgi:serine/threonine protein kinase
MLVEEVRGDKAIVKVADFGVRMLLDPEKGLRQIGYWTAPEVLEGQEITPAADIYAFGVLVLEVLMRKVPSEEDIREGCVPGQVPANLSNLVIQCVQVRPEMRPTSQMLLDVFDSICA